MREALVGLGIALLGGPLLRAAVWRAPLSALTPREVLVTALGPAVAYGVTMLVLRLVLAATGTDAELASAIACFFGDVVALSLVALTSYRTRLVGLLRVLGEALHDPARKRESLASLERVLDAAKPQPGADVEPYGALVVHLAGVLVGVNDHAAARRTLERVEGKALSASLHAKHAQCLATVCLETGDLERANEVLAAVTDHGDDALTARWLEITRALLFAIDGGAEKAMQIVGTEDDTHDEDAFRAMNAIVRAHVHACLGEDDAAREDLVHARTLAGVVALTRAIRPVGPATDLARALLAEDVARMRGQVAS